MPPANSWPRSSWRACAKTARLDDARYAKQFTRQRTEIRRQGKFRIARDLRARGVPDTHIEAAVEERHRRCRRARRHPPPHRSQAKADPRGEISDNKIASLYRSLLAAGFPSDAIRRELKSLATEFPETDTDPD